MFYLFFQVLKVQPNNGFAKSHLGFIMKTVKQNFKEAITLLQEGVESGDKGADDGRFYFHLGDALNRIGKPKEVQRYYGQDNNHRHPLYHHYHLYHLHHFPYLGRQGTFMKKQHKRRSSCQLTSVHCTMLTQSSERSPGGPRRRQAT